MNGGVAACIAGKKPKKKKSGLSLEPVQEDLLTAAVNCLKLLAVADNSDLFRWGLAESVRRVGGTTHGCTYSNRC